MNQVGLIFSLVGVLILAAFLMWLHHAGYRDGQAERTAYYEPLLKAAKDAKVAADARTATIEAASADAVREIEDHHVAKEKVLADRADTLADHIASLVRQHAAAASRCDVSKATGTAAEPGGAAAFEQRIAGISERFGRIAKACEADAVAVGQLQSFYNEQRALINSAR